ncbi:hypothetical protein HDV05_008819, partial [Chytridiales sp. JEL 0842]
MHFTSIFAAALSILSVSAAIIPTTTPNPAGDTPDPKDITLGRDIYFEGPGCPPETIGVLFNKNRTEFSIFFDQYVLSIGYDNFPLSESRKYCTVKFDVDAPQGWQYSLRSIEYQGYWIFDEGTVGSSTAYYYFKESLRSSKDTMFRPTPTTNQANYVVRDSFPLDVWSPCGGRAKLHVGTTIKLSGSGRGMMTVDSVFGRVTHVYALNWRR